MLAGAELAPADRRLPHANWRITQAEIGELPSGGHVAGLLEFLYQPAVMANTDTGGFARAENTQIAMLGESYKWQRWYFGGADISNPSRPGEPLLYLPLAVLSQVEMNKYGALQSDRNGVQMTARDADGNVVRPAKPAPANRRPCTDTARHGRSGACQRLGSSYCVARLWRRLNRSACTVPAAFFHRAGVYFR